MARSLLPGALEGWALWRIELNGNAVAAREELFRSLDERIRDMRMGPDGWLYRLLGNASGRILRVER